MRMQRLLGSDIAMAFDECPPGRRRPRPRRGGGATHEPGAQRSRAQPRAEGQLGFGIVQGGTDLDLRRSSAEEIVAIGFDGYARRRPLGRRGARPMLETLAATRRAAARRPAALPDGRRRPASASIEGIARGVDMFDCVLPTRLGRTGSALVPGGRINLRNAAFAQDEAPLVEGCTCPACAGFSRAYIRHLVTQSEISGLRLLTIHNLHTLLDLAARARAAIAAGRFEQLRLEVSAGVPADGRREPIL